MNGFVPSLEHSGALSNLTSFISCLQMVAVSDTRLCIPSGSVSVLLRVLKFTQIDGDSTAHLESGQPVRMVLWKSKALENLCNILSILSQFLVKMYEFILGLTFGGYLGKDAGAAVEAQGA